MCIFCTYQIDNLDDDPDYVPEGVAMDDTEENNETEPQPSPAGDDQLDDPVNEPVDDPVNDPVDDQPSGAAANPKDDPELQDRLGVNDRPLAATQRGSDDDGQVC